MDNQYNSSDNHPITPAYQSLSINNYKFRLIIMLIILILRTNLSTDSYSYTPPGDFVKQTVSEVPLQGSFTIVAVTL